MRLKTRTNFKISWTSNFGSKIWAKLQAKPNFSSQFLRVSEILKFDLRYKFIKRETRGLELRSRPLIPLFKSSKPLARSKCMRWHYRAACVLLSSKFSQNLKFHERVISTLNLVLNVVQPKFSKLLRRVSKVLKFAE